MHQPHRRTEATIRVVLGLLFGVLVMLLVLGMALAFGS